RKPPFQMGEKEKGFRDAIILETFLQLVDGASSNRSTTRLVLVSNDGLLREATLLRIGESNNVHILESIDALKGLINTLGSSVDEKYIAQITDLAADLFFKKDVENSLYYKWGVYNGLQNALKAANLNLPSGAD